MKKLFPFVALISFLMLACNISSATPTVPPTIPIPPTAPATSTPSGPAANVSCHELSFYLDPLVAAGSTCTIVPARLTGIGAHPQYTQVTLTTYQTGSAVTPEVDVFSVQSWHDAFPPNGISDFLTALQGLIAGGTPGQTLPYLNPHESAQALTVQYQVLHSAGSSGIRYLTQMVQNYAVIDNNDLFYTYQGVTADGQYAVTVILPIANPVLPNHGDTYPGGETAQQFYDNFPTYIANTTNQLNTQPASTFAPSLGLLDDLARSIQVHP